MTVKSVGIGMGATVLTKSPGSSLRRESKPWGIWVEEIESAVAPRQVSTWCVFSLARLP